MSLTESSAELAQDEITKLDTHDSTADTASDSAVSSDEEEPKEEEKYWQIFLSSVIEEIVGSIFTCFLKRAASVLFSVDFSAPNLPPVLGGELAKKPVYKLKNISIGLFKMYHAAKDESQRKQLLDLVAQNSPFIYLVIQLACKVIQISDLQCWLTVKPEKKRKEKILDEHGNSFVTTV